MLTGAAILTRGGMFYLKADLRALQTKWAAAKTKQAKARVAEEHMDLVSQRCDVRARGYDPSHLTLTLISQFDREMDAWQKAESQRIKAENDKIRRERQAQCARPGLLRPTPLM